LLFIDQINKNKAIQMIRSFSSWSRLNEAVARGKEILTVNGKTQKVKYRVQSKEKFIIKIVNDLDVLDSNSKLTPAGEEAIIAFFNSEPAFTSQIGQLSPAFFEKSLIVYLVRKDKSGGAREVQKIQFSVEPRLDAENKPLYPSIAQSERFVDENKFKGASKDAATALSLAQTLLTNTQLEDPESTVTEPTAAPTEIEDSSVIGKKFLYTMRTNSKIYLMEFTADDKLKATTQDGSDPNGEITHTSSGENGEYTIFWDTALDNTSRDTAISKKVNANLYTDGTIYNATDRKFIHRMFTDKDFRDQQIKTFEDEYKSTIINSDNLRRMLFYKDGTSIFPQDDSESVASRASDTDDREYAMGELRKAIQKTLGGEK